jgi:hypothetical protein
MCGEKRTANMGEEFSEEQRAERLGILRAAHPEIDIEALAGGTLAGPASPDRPPVPVWDYLDYLTAHPELSVDEMSHIRFPIALYGGTTMVTSIAELTAPGPAVPTYAPAADDIVQLYRLMYQAGALRWNPQSRTHEEIKPRAAYVKSVYDKWRALLQSKIIADGTA